MANDNISALLAMKGGSSGGGGGGSGTDSNAVHYYNDSNKTHEQKAAALANVGGEPKKMTVTFTESGGVYSSDKTYSQISAALTAGKIVAGVYGNKVAVCIGNIGGAIQFILIESFNNYSLTDGTKVTFFDIEANDDVSVGSINYHPVSVDAASVLTAIQTMSAAQAAAVLTKIGGEPKKLTVTFSYENSVWSTNKSLTEITTAVAAGNIVVGVYTDSNSVKHEFTLWQKHSLYADFVCVGYDDTTGNLSVEVMSIDDGDAVTYSAANFQKNPATVTDLSSTSITLASAAANTEYHYGELSALTISSIPATGYFEITFTSGSTATVLTVPNTMIMPDGFTVEANTRYEINVKDGYAVVAGWAVSA